MSDKANSKRNLTENDVELAALDRAKLRVMVKRILRKYGFPLDKWEAATETVLAQAELLCADWAGGRPAPGLWPACG